MGHEQPLIEDLPYREICDRLLNDHGISICVEYGNWPNYGNMWFSNASWIDDKNKPQRLRESIAACNIGQAVRLVEVSLMDHGVV